MAERKVIMDQIKTDLEDKIKASRGYKTTPVEVRRGVHKWNDFSVKPVIGFTLVRDSADENAEHGEIARWLTVYFYGYAETAGLEGVGDTDMIHDLAQDVEDFLMSDTDFTYSKYTLVGDTEIKEGGVSDRVNAFLIETRIAYYPD